MRELNFTRQPMLKMWDANTDKPSFLCRHFVAGFHGRHPRPLAVLLGIWSTSVPLCTPGPRDDIQCIYHLIRMRIFFDTFSLFYPSLSYYVNFGTSGSKNIGAHKLLVRGVPSLPYSTLLGSSSPAYTVML